MHAVHTLSYQISQSLLALHTIKGLLPIPSLNGAASQTHSVGMSVSSFVQQWAEQKSGLADVTLQTTRSLLKTFNCIMSVSAGLGIDRKLAFLLPLPVLGLYSWSLGERLYGFASSCMTQRLHCCEGGVAARLGGGDGKA